MPDLKRENRVWLISEVGVPISLGEFIPKGTLDLLILSVSSLRDIRFDFDPFSEKVAFIKESEN